MQPGSTRLGLLTALIGITAVIAIRLPTIQDEVQADSLPATSLPLKLGQWQGEEVPVPTDVKKALPTARIMSHSYRCPTGAADVTIITGSDATVLHDPHDCLRGEGWQFLSDQSREVEVGGKAGRIRVRDVVMVNGDTRAHLWYWYSIGSEIFNSTLPARLGLFRTRLTEGRGRRAEFVRLIAWGETDSNRSTLMLSDLARQVAGR
jgi:EpsI family protein